MSRVIRKLAEGGTSEQKKLFEWAGSKYDKDALKNAYAKKYQSEINSGKYSKRELQLLDEGFKQVVSTIDSDDFGRDISGEWTNTAGVGSTGFADKNIFGRLKKTDNNSVSLAASILNDTFSNLSPYSSQEVETPKKEQFDLNLKNRLQKRLMPGEKGWNQNIWSDLEKGQKDDSGKLFTTGRQQAIRDTLLGLANDLENPENKDKYQYQDFIKDPSEYSKQIRSLVRDGSTKGLLGDIIGDAGDLATLSKFGITGFEGLLQDEQVNPEEPIGETPEQKMERARLETNKKDWTSFVNQIKQGDQSKQWGAKLSQTLDQVIPTKKDSDKTPVELFQSVVPNISLTQSTQDNPIPVDIPLNKYLIDRPSDKTRMASLRKNIEDYKNNDPRAKEYTEGDYTYVLPTLSEEGKYIVRYNNKTNTAQRVLSSESPKVLEYLKKAFLRNRDPNIANRQGVFKGGGIIKLQLGNVLDEMETEYQADLNAKKVQTKEKTKQEENRKAQVAATKPKAPVNKPIEKGFSNIWGDDKDSRVVDGWTGTEWTRLGAAIADLGAIGLAYVPGWGTAASLGAGVGSTLANATADVVEDGLDWGDAGRFGTNIMADLVGLVPGFGAAAKGSKIIKNIARFGPKILTIAGSIGVAPSIVTSMKKAFSDEKLTAADYRNFAEGLKLVLANGKMAKRHVQGKILENELATGNNMVRTTKGFESISPKALDELKSKKGLAEQNKFLGVLGLEGSLKTKFGGSKLNPTRDWNNPEVIREFNFDKPKTRMTSSGEVLVKRTSIEQNRINNMQRSSLSIPSPLSESAKIKINDWKYGKAVATAKAMPNMNKVRVEFVKKNPSYNKLTNEELLEQVREQLNPAVYNAAVKEIKNPVKPKKTTMDLNLDELKLGGVLKGQRGLVMNRETVPAPNPYLTLPNTEANARNQELWNKYYDLNKAMSDMGTNKWTSGTTVGGLNNLYSLREQVPANINQKGALNFNTSFDKNLGVLNTKVFGKGQNKFDYMGPSTYNRKALLDKMALAYNSPENTIETADGNAYFNGTRWVTLPIQAKSINQPLQSNTPELSLATPKVTNQAIPQQKTNIQFSGLRPKTNQGSQFLPEDAIALGRMVGTVGANNWANRRIQSALRPTLIDTYENYIPQTEDYLAKTSANNNAAEIQRQAGRIAAGTSDASLGAAAMLEGTRQGSQIRLQGDLANSQRLYQTGEQGRAESNTAKARRVEVANRNKASMNQIELAKAQMDAQTKVGNWMQAVQPWAAGIENRLRTNRSTQKQLDLQANELASQQGVQKARLGLIEEFKNKDMSNPSVQAEFQTKMMGIDNEASRNSLENTATTVGRGVWFKRPLSKNTLFGNSKVTYSARGSKLTARDSALIERAKDFNRTMRDQQKNFLREIQSIRREHGQMMKHLSSFTADLIKSGMSWK